MFDMLASKLGEAQAFADGLAVNLDVMNMDRWGANTLSDKLARDFLSPAVKNAALSFVSSFAQSSR